MFMGVAASALLIFAPSAAAAIDYASGNVVRAPSCAAGCSAGSFAFDVQSGIHGGNPTGYVAVDFPGTSSLTGVVTCLHMQGSTATILGRITYGSGDMDPSLYTGQVYFVFMVKDVGTASGGRPAPDRISHIEWNTANNWKAQFGLELADICADPTPVLTSPDLFKLIGGNLKVVNN
jgi:hypothetical protein